VLDIADDYLAMKLFRSRSTQDYAGNLRFMGIAHHPINAFESREFFRRTLGEAARNENLCIGILTMNAANRVPRVGIRAGSDRASI
jgi:hypothetical protein